MENKEALNCLRLINSAINEKHIDNSKAKNKINLSNTFHRYFEVIPAYMKVLIRQAKRLRYQIYYVENKMSHTANPVTMMEEDEYDNHSVHCLLRHRKSGTFAGTVRLILSDPAKPDKKFPLEVHGKIDKNIIYYPNFKRDNVAEVSRLAVCKKFKSRGDEGQTISGVDPNVNYRQYIEDERAFTPHIVIMGLIAATFVMSAEYGITHWYAFLEPALLKLLEHMGMRFQSVGPLTDYYGQQVPTIADVNELLLSIRSNQQDFWSFIFETAYLWKSSKPTCIV